MLAASLAHEDVRQLLAHARATESDRDDSLVGQIDALRRQIAEEETEVREDRERLKVLASRRRELEDIEWEFKKSRFDDPRSSFQRDELTGDLLSEFLRGAITAGAYWGHWRDSQRWRESTRQAGGRVGLPRDLMRGAAIRGVTKAAEQIANSIGSGGSGSPWGRLPGGGSSGGGFNRPRRSGSSGGRKHGGFKTGGRF
jgi:hypothetical protein